MKSTIIILAAALSAVVIQAAKVTPQLLYVWAGETNGTSPDIVAVYDFTPGRGNFGKLKNIVNLRGRSDKGNEPHHCSFNRKKSVFAAGGLLSLLKPDATNDELFYFHVGSTYQDALKPIQIQATLDAANPPKSAVADEYIALSSGGFAVTMMGRNDGMCPGRVVEISSDLSLVGEYPLNDTNIENPGCFCPHGLSIDEKRGVAITGDFLVPATILPGVPGPVVCDSFRIWDWKTRTIRQTVRIPGAQGFMNTNIIPNDPHQRAYVVPMVNGTVGLTLVNLADGSYKNVLNLPAGDGSLTFVRLSKNGNRLFLAANVVGRLFVVDTTIKDKPVLIQTINLPDSGIHYTRLDKDEKYVLVSGYFLEAGKVSMGGDHKVYIFRNGPKGLTKVNVNIDLDDAVPGLKYKPHGFDFWWA